MKEVNIYRREIDVILPILEKAGELVLRFFKEKNYSISMKSPNNPLTEADLACNKLLIETIQKNFPKDSVLSEESHELEGLLPNRHEANRVWILDPIDGTKEFIEGIPEFAISVGLVEKHQPVLGFIYNPAQQFLIYGGHSIGIFLNGNRLVLKRREIYSLQEIYGCFSRSEFKKGLFKKMETHLKIEERQTLGSIAYKMGLVAAGKFDLVLSYRPKNEWDIAAGASLFRSLDYPLLDSDFEPVLFNQKKTRLNGLLGGVQDAIRLYRKTF